MPQEILDYLELMARQRAEMLRTVEGLPPEALDWTPLPDITSSIAVLVNHSAGVIRLWFVEGLTGQETARDRAKEFAARGHDAAALADLIEAAFDDAEAALKSSDPKAWDTAAPLTLHHNTRGQVHTPRFGIAYALSHAGEHLGHMQLTRQLWEARGA